MLKAQGRCGCSAELCAFRRPSFAKTENSLVVVFVADGFLLRTRQVAGRLRVRTPPVPLDYDKK